MIAAVTVNVAQVRPEWLVGQTGVTGHYAGLCLCADGWEGADCSVDLSAGPRLANLGNNGLCDVRSKPCKSLIVSGDNFANNNGLVCRFEVFKVIQCIAIRSRL